MVYPYHGILLSNKKKGSIDLCNNMDGSPGNYAKCKKPVSKDFMLCNSMHTTFLKWHNYRNREQFNDWQD